MDVSVSLTPELVGFLKSEVESGRYESTSDVVSEALKLLRQADETGSEIDARLRTAWDEGIDSGDAGPLDFATIKADGRRRLAVLKKG